MNAVEKKPKKTKSYHLPLDLIERVGHEAVRRHVPPCRLVEQAIESALAELARGEHAA